MNNNTENYLRTFWGLGDNLPMENNRLFFNPVAPLFGKNLFMNLENPTPKQTTNSNNANIVENQEYFERCAESLKNAIFLNEEAREEANKSRLEYIPDSPIL